MNKPISLEFIKTASIMLNEAYLQDVEVDGFRYYPLQVNSRVLRYFTAYRRKKMGVKKKVREVR